MTDITSREPFIPLHLRRRDGIKQTIILNTEDTINNYKNKINELENRILVLLDQNAKLTDTITELKMVPNTAIENITSEKKPPTLIRTTRKGALSKADFIARRSTLQARSSDTLQALRKLALVKERIAEAKKMDLKEAIEPEEKHELRQMMIKEDV